VNKGISEYIPPPKRATLTAKEAAEYIGISYWLILELAKRKEIPAIYAGKRVLFRVETLNRWMDGQEAKAVEKPVDTGHGKIRRIL